MRRIINWMATDGLLHFFVCATISLAFLNLFECLWFALVMGAIPAIAKEVYDVYIQKDNNYQQAGHDLICDAMGLLLTLIIYLI